MGARFTIKAISRKAYNRYLAMARLILRARRVPLSARDLVQEAEKLGLMPADLGGKTQHKTMQARLSTDILFNRERSFFYRVSPGRFFLREFLDDPEIDIRWKEE